MGQHSLKTVVKKSRQPLQLLGPACKTANPILQPFPKDPSITKQNQWSSPFCAKGVLSLTMPPENQLSRQGAASCMPGLRVHAMSILICRACVRWSPYTVCSPAMTCHSLLCESNGCGISRVILPLMGSQGLKQADATMLPKGQSLQNQRTQMVKIISVTAKCWSIDFVPWEELASWAWGREMVGRLCELRGREGETMTEKRGHRGHSGQWMDSPSNVQAGHMMDMCCLPYP